MHLHALWHHSLGTTSRATSAAQHTPLHGRAQIKVPPQLAEVLKDYTKEVIRRQPEDLIEFSAFYFSNLANIIPDNSKFTAPTIHQIAEVYKAVTSCGAVRTCDVRLGLQLAVHCLRV